MSGEKKGNAEQIRKKKPEEKKVVSREGRGKNVNRD